MTLRYVDPVPDRGQRYEVRCRDARAPSSHRVVLGRSNDLQVAEHIATAARAGRAERIVWIADRQWAGLEEAK